MSLSFAEEVTWMSNIFSVGTASNITGTKLLAILLMPMLYSASFCHGLNIIVGM